jgi:hypothetical protein
MQTILITKDQRPNREADDGSPYSSRTQKAHKIDALNHQQSLLLACPYNIVAYCSSGVTLIMQNYGETILIN